MSEKHEPNKTPGLVSWNELTSNHGEASVKFYTELFGWQREDIDTGHNTYTLFKVGGHPVAGMYAVAPEIKKMPPVWISYVTVENIESALEKAKKLGAEVFKEITTLQMGRFAIVRDPQGAIVGLWQFI